ncbi:hypothetical protein A8L59_15200 [Pseudomonas koreensis]|uniref:Uncharacterized protein n=1 Tax=Pseudomonas koreensis TaxID=198620 RepID=A0AAC9C1D2_9PSED|nr:hypothetical protein A8L59_15200 [Pseudomonas koreensis]
MNVPGFEHEDFARGAVMPCPTAVEALHTLLGEADQVGLMPMRIVGVRVPGEMRVQGFDAGFPVVGKVDPVTHGLNTLMGWGQ